MTSHQQKTLEQRMLASEYLLDLILNDLQQWITAAVCEYENNNNPPRPYYLFLYKTSWRQKHESSNVPFVDGLTILIQATEETFKHHAEKNTAWWQENEPKLRQSSYDEILYLLLLSYKENPEANTAGIATLILNKNLLHHGFLEYELGELAGISFHLLTDSDQKLFQHTVLSLYDDEDWNAEKVRQKKYDYLVWIPDVFRLAKTKNLIRQFPETPLPTPQVHSWITIWDGSKKSSINLDDFLQLSSISLYNLLVSEQDDLRSHLGEHCIGGQEEISRTLSKAAAYNPLRYFNLMLEFDRQGLNASYSVSILQGIADHLRYRFGRLRPSDKNWQPVEPAPDVDILAEILLNTAERFDPVWQDGYAISHIIEACCEVIEDTASAERLIFLLFRLCKHPDPEKIDQRIFSQGKEGITTEDILSDALNRVRGVAAGAAMTLANRLLEKEIELPELLFPLLRHYALDHVQSVRAALLQGLPFLTSKRPAWGWQLFEDIFRDAPTLLWPLAERHLYHQYHNHFEKVAPCLDRIQQEAPTEAGEAWGRIATLSSLAGHLPQESLFAQLEQAGQPKQWKGAAQVFAA
ncbi:MAG: hypothetical protein D3924_16870, partial [Candidatus Electrothrix sp. AR4]|nr:hypothetical protein [Candidatus Electrothrix sp. AR4]